MKEALLILLGILFLLGVALDWAQFQEELKDMRSEESDDEKTGKEIKGENDRANTD